jgi:DNA-directed RNA polymerase subunit M/transcription elongation factor TFIIS
MKVNYEPCPKCGSRNVEEDIEGSEDDVPRTVWVYKCLDCGEKWRREE